MPGKRQFKIRPAPEGRPYARKVQILLLLATQKSNEEIIKEVNCTKGEIDNVVKQYKAKGDFEDKPRSGRPEVLSATAKRSINRHINQSPTDTLKDLQRVFKGCGTNGITPSRPTFTAAVEAKRIGRIVAHDKENRVAEEEASRHH